jgi:endonuclease/exonuclease/phosphatase family metal-dependent hydrolase
VSRLLLDQIEQLRFPPAGGGEQRTAVVGTVRVGPRAVTVAAAHLSNKQGHNVRQLRQLQGVLAGRPAPRLLLGDLNLSWAVLLVASRRGWPGAGRGDTIPELASQPAA